MSVVEKIEECHYKTEIRTFDFSFGWHYMSIGDRVDEIAYAKSNSKIEAVWLAVVDFIEWHNQNNTTSH